MFGKIVKIAVIIMGLGWIASRVWGGEGEVLTAYQRTKLQIQPVSYRESFQIWLGDLPIIKELNPAVSDYANQRWVNWGALYWNSGYIHAHLRRYPPIVNDAIGCLKEWQANYAEGSKEFEIIHLIIDSLENPN
jgi:hypothetical protein